jgi:hypothetical protein
MSAIFKQFKKYNMYDKKRMVKQMLTADETRKIIYSSFFVLFQFSVNSDLFQN